MRTSDIARTGTVVALQGGRMRLSLSGSTACGSCAGKVGCGAGREQSVTLPHDVLPAGSGALLRSGGRVELRLVAGTLTAMVARVYVVPSFAALSGGWLGSLAGGDIGTALGAICAVGLCYGLLKRYDSPRALGVVIAGAGRSGNGASNP